MFCSCWRVTSCSTRPPQRRGRSFSVDPIGITSKQPDANALPYKPSMRKGLQSHAGRKKSPGNFFAHMCRQKKRNADEKTTNTNTTTTNNNNLPTDAPIFHLVVPPPHLASLKTRNSRNDLNAEMAPPALSPEAPVKMAGGEIINSSKPLMTMKPSNRLKLSRAYSRGPRAASWDGKTRVRGGVRNGAFAGPVTFFVAVFFSFFFVLVVFCYCCIEMYVSSAAVLALLFCFFQVLLGIG